MDSILNYLSVPDLKSCRLVSSQYNEIACKALQREETIVFKTIPQLETYVNKIKPISSHTPGACSPSLSICSELSSLSGEYDEEGDLVAEKQGTDEDEYFWPCFNIENKSECDRNDDDRSASPFCHDHQMDCYNYYNSLYRYSHRSFHFDYCDPSSELEAFDQFFQMFGWQIKRLKYTTDLLPYNFPKPLGHMGDVWKDRLYNLEELVLEMKWGIPAYLFPNANVDDASPGDGVLLPSLRKLNLDILLTDRDADRAHVYLQQLLTVTPNIEEISIPGSKRYFDDYINCVLARVIISSEVPKLSILNFCLALSDAQMRLLTGRNLPLSTLILDLEDLQQQADGDQVVNQDLQQPNDDNNQGENQEDDLHHDFLRQNQNRRPSFTPIVKSTLQRFMNSLATTLRSLHICFPQSPRHNLHTFTFQQEMVELKFLALGYYAGPSRILDHLPALKKLELWNVQFQDCNGVGNKVVPDKYQEITSVIS